MRVVPSWLSYLFLFSLFFPIGFWTGRQISPLDRKTTLSIQVKAFSPKSKGTKYPLPVDRQRAQLSENRLADAELAQTNLLILFVDDLGSRQPKLISLWLLIYPKDSSRLIFLPIFQENNPAVDLVSTFQLNRERLDKRFVEAVKKRNILWHSFLVLDHSTQKQLADQIVPSLVQEPILSTAILNGVCQKISVQPQILADFKPLIGDHLLSDFDLETALDLWQLRLSAQPHLLCEFPSLSH